MKYFSLTSLGNKGRSGGVFWCTAAPKPYWGPQNSTYMWHRWPKKYSTISMGKHVVWKPQWPCAVPKVGVHYNSILWHCATRLWQCYLVWHQLDTDVLMSISHLICTSPHDPCYLIWLGLTEGGWQDAVSSPVTTLGQPDSQLDATAAKPAGWLHLCCSEMWGQLYYPGGA